MKRTFITFVSALVLFLASSELLYAQNDSIAQYIPFVEQGKHWHVVRSDWDGRTHFDHFMLTNEEVEKDGKTYMKMYRSEDDLTVVYDAGLLREENRKLYFFDTEMQKEFLVFDLFPLFT